MIKHVIHLAYDGSSYRGWQRQSNVVSVQQVVEEAISKVLNIKTTVQGCGRTDALVHASQYFAQFKTERELEPQFVFVINKVLPPEIRVYSVTNAPVNFNVQHSAIKRTYRYYFHTKPNPFINKFSSYYERYNLNLGKMKEALALFIGYYDFHSFCKSPDKHTHTMVDITNTQMFFNENKGIYCIEIAGDRFLKGMIRSIVHHIIEIGKGKLEAEDIQKKLQMAASYPNIQLAYPQGLYLSRVQYESLNEAPNNETMWYLLK